MPQVPVREYTYETTHGGRRMSKGDETMGQRFKRLRVKADMTQDDLSRAAHVSLAAIRNLEQGVTEPTFTTAIRIARALGVSLDELAKDVPLREPKRRGPKGGRR